MLVSVCMCMCVCVSIYMYVCVCVYVCACVCMCVCAHTHAFLARLQSCHNRSTPTQYSYLCLLSEEMPDSQRQQCGHMYSSSHCSELSTRPDLPRLDTPDTDHFATPPHNVFSCYRMGATLVLLYTYIIPAAKQNGKSRPGQCPGCCYEITADI